MTAAKQAVKDLCDKLMEVNPSQILIDLVQDDIEEILEADDVTPDQINSLAYRCDNLYEVYNHQLKEEMAYLKELSTAISKWGNEAGFANKILGIDPNK